MRLTLIATLAALATATPVLAEKIECNVPKDKWQTEDALRSQLTAEGWTIKTVKVDEGCYEVYAHDKDGKKVEVYFDPATLKPVGQDKD